MTVYTQQIRDALTSAIDTGKLAEAWQALHPKDVAKATVPAPDRSGCQLPGTDRNGSDQAAVQVSILPGKPHTLSPAVQSAGHATKAISPVLSAFLKAAREAITRALASVLRKVYTEGWVLGQLAARAAVSLAEVDWGAWTPGDAAAAEAIAGPGLRQLLANDGIQIKSITESRLEELADVLEATLASDEVHRPPLPEPLPPVLSVGDLARQLKDVLDNPANAELVAQAEIGRAQAEAARTVYGESGVAEVEISTAADDKVCPVCEAAEKVGPHPVGVAPMVLLHPRCRCAELPVLAGAS